MKRILSLLKKILRLGVDRIQGPAGYAEYMRALARQDAYYDFYSNPFFLTYVLPLERQNPEIFLLTRGFVLNKRKLDRHQMETRRISASSSIPSHQSSSSSSAHSPFRVNPSSGLPMTGSYDSRGNTYGFNNTFSSSSHSRWP